MNITPMRTSFPARLSRVLLVALLSLASVSDAQWWDPNPPPREPWDRGKPVVYKRHADIERASMQIQQAIFAGDVAKIERMHDEFLALQQAGGNGRWMLASVGRAFEGASLTLIKDRARTQALVASWKERFPDSKLRPSFEAAIWIASAWSHRGHDYASTVSPEAMKLFRDEQARAMQVLKEGEAKGKGSPLWYQSALTVAGGTGQPPAVLDAIFEEGAARFPNDLRLYETRLNFLLPQWGGSYERVDDFIRRAVIRTQATEGTSLYAALYYRVRRSREQKDFFGGTKASWKLMRHGFEDGIVLEGDPEWMTIYATFACIAEDHVTLRRVIPQLAPHARIGMGLAGVSPEVCAEMARE